MMKRVFIFMVVITVGNARPMEHNLHDLIQNALGQSSQALHSFNEVIDIIAMGSDLAGGGSNNQQKVRILKDKLAQAQRIIVQISLLNRELNDPRNSTVHIGLLVTKKIEELLLLVRESLSSVNA